MKNIEVTDYVAQEIEIMRDQESYGGKICQLAKAMSAVIFAMGTARDSSESIDVDGCFDALDLLGNQVRLYSEFSKDKETNNIIHFKAVGGNRHE